MPLTALRERLLRLEQRLYFGVRKKAGNADPAHLQTGERGEDLAYFHLRAQGYTVVARRWRSDRLRGDLDLVAWDGDTLVIFEIKTRTKRDFAPAELAVDPEKQRMLRRMSAAYVRQFPEQHRERVPVRFDVLAVYIAEGEPEFEHFRDAFGRG